VIVMTRHSFSPFTVWGTLLLLTGLSYLSWLDAYGANPRITGLAVLIIALIKAWLIGEQFMELDKAYWPLRLIFSFWVVTVGAVLITTFALAP